MATDKSFTINHLALRLDKKGRLTLLDQQKLPKVESWVEVNDLEVMKEAIIKLKVRGAPLIGLSAALSLGLWAKNSSLLNKEEILKMIDELEATRPTAVNLKNNLDCLRQVIHDHHDGKKGLGEKLFDRALNLWKEDELLSEGQAQVGEKLIKDGDRIMTICNTGSLACAGGGTALGVIKKAWENKKAIHVYVLETRPLLQGARLTTYELEKAKIPYTLITDSMQGYVMDRVGIDIIFVGADRITSDGYVANKIGTYTLATSARFHGVPFYAVAPHTTKDLNNTKGLEVEIEMRRSAEVKGFDFPHPELINAEGKEKALEWSPSGARCINPAFDLTPPSLVTGYVYDTGIEEN
jgi:methylthioribose-1-phosphate isomerase